MSEITIGVDFAASPRNTAACEVHWTSDEAVVVRVVPALDDAAFLGLLDGLPRDGRLGIDCPLGWPVGFVEAVRAHHERSPWPGRDSPDRARFVWRATDRWVRDHFGRWPLSVSTDRIGVTALRAAYLLDAWETAGGRVDRSGVEGPIVEVYPAMARRGWGLSALRSVDEVEAGLPIRFSDQVMRQACAASEHCFDALIAALVARAAALRLTDPPPDELLAMASTEGWIHVPTHRMSSLVGAGVGSNVHSDGNSRLAAPAPAKGRGRLGSRGADVPPRPL